LKFAFFCNFDGHLTLTLDLSQHHTNWRHSSSSIYPQIFIKIGVQNLCTYGQTDKHRTHLIRS